MLEKIADYIRNNKNIIEKEELNPIVDFISTNCFKSPRIFSDLGQDSAAISNNNEMLTLVTTDRIKTSYIEKYPFGAGFSSILVGVDDIYACGGKPLAATIIISYKERNIGQEMIEGLCNGSNKFKVPIVRGHTNTKDYYELSSTIIGEIKKEDYIPADKAQENDKIILAVDFDGQLGKASSLHWDTVTQKSSEVVLNKRLAMNAIAKQHIVNSSKDISNGGIFGTILQLLKYSRVGADINVNKIVLPPKLIDMDYHLKTYVQMFLTTSYILTAPKEACSKVIEIFNEHNMSATIIGKIRHEQELNITDGNDSIKVIEF
ncbi:MAG: AIR synthase related protein [Promethearchaeota archaeon]|jgi:selenophosphate synthetase-related protein